MTFQYTYMSRFEKTIIFLGLMCLVISYPWLAFIPMLLLLGNSEERR